MQKAEVADILARQPFVPLKIVKTDGSTIDVPFSHVAQPLSGSVIVFKGVKREGSHAATGFEEVVYDRIDRIEPRTNSRPRRPRKAS